jgi:hypothetical protein
MTIKHLDSYFQIALMRNWHASAGLARASVLSGDAANAREAYHEFFEVWRDSDADLPIFIEARSEHETLK